MPIDRDMQPFGPALQADVVALQNGLASALGIVERGLAEGSPTVESLQTALQLTKEALLDAMEDQKQAEAFRATRGIGGFDGGPKIDWGKVVD